MKPDPDDLPELLRERILRQRKRLKIVRVTLGLTIVAAIALMVAANQAQSSAPAARVMFVLPQESGLWLLDQHLEPSQQGARGGSFALLDLQGEGIVASPRYEGTARSVTMIGHNEVGVTTSTRFMRFTRRDDGWERGEFQSLGLNDPTASPSVVSVGGDLWMCWTRGTDVLVQPLGRPEVAPRSLYQTKTPDIALLTRVSNGVIWAASLEVRTGELSLVAFKPGTEASPIAAPDTGADAVPDPADVALRTTVHRTFSSTVAEGVARFTFAVLETEAGPRPIVAYTRKDDDKRMWQLRHWVRENPEAPGTWVDAAAPARKHAPSSMDMSNFITLASRGTTLLAVFNDKADVFLAEATPKADGSVEWSEAAPLGVDATRGVMADVVSIIIVFVALLVVASQMVWLMLNRERGMDRALAELLEKQAAEKGTEGQKKKEKGTPPLLYANAFSRAFALVIDLALTSPLVILLQGVYGYKLEQAYGFIALGAFETMGSEVIQTLQATAVALIVLSMYAMICELVWGRSLGKALFRLRVVDAKGEAPAAWRIVVRNFMRIPELIHWVILMIPMGVMLLSGKGQRIGDLLSGTFVVVDAVPEESPDDIDI